MNTEKRLNLAQLQDALAELLPRRPSQRLLYKWMEAVKFPMPYETRLEGVVMKTDDRKKRARVGREFYLTEVMAWYANPSEFWAKKNKAS